MIGKIDFEQTVICYDLLIKKVKNTNLRIKHPQIKFRRMVSRWGSCHFVNGILTFDTNLMYALTECIKYVVLHEFNHFLQPNHSDKFYDEFSKVCPEWKSGECD